MNWTGFLLSVGLSTLGLVLGMLLISWSRSELMFWLLIVLWIAPMLLDCAWLLARLGIDLGIAGNDIWADHLQYRGSISLVGTLSSGLYFLIFSKPILWLTDQERQRRWDMFWDRVLRRWERRRRRRR